MTNNSKLQRGQLIISKQIGSVNIDINSLTRIPSFVLPLGNTVGHYPFGFNVLFLSNDETVGIFGKGTKLLHKVTLDYNNVEDKYILTNVYGDGIIFYPIDDVTIDSVTYKYQSKLDNSYLSISENDYTIRDPRGNITKRRLTDDLILDYKGKDGSNYYLRNETSTYKEYVSINNPSAEEENRTYSRIIIMSDSVTIYEQTLFVSKVSFTYGSDGRISSYKVYKNTATNLVESYSFIKESESQITTSIKVYDNIRKKYINIIDHLGQRKTTLSTYTYDTESATVISTLTLQSDFIEIEQGEQIFDNTTLEYDDGYKVSHRYLDGLIESVVDNRGFAKTYEFVTIENNYYLKEESNTLQIFTTRNLGANLFKDGNFEEGISNFDIIGTGSYAEETFRNHFNQEYENNKFLRLQTTSILNPSEVNRPLVKKGLVGDEHTLLVYLYVKEALSETVSVGLRLTYLNGVNAVNADVKSYSLKPNEFYVLTLSVPASNSYENINAKVTVLGNGVIYIKEFGLYEVPVGNKYKYNEYGRVIYQKSGKKEIKYTYDSSLRLSSIESDQSKQNIIEYDEKGRIIKSTDIYGNTTEYTYHSDTNEIYRTLVTIPNYNDEGLADPSNDEVFISINSIIEDIANNKKTYYRRSPESYETTEVYDFSKSKLTYYSSALENALTYTYNSYEDLIKIIEGNNLRDQEITYDAERKVDKLISPLEGTYKYTYNPFGDIETVSKDNIPLVSFTYQSIDDKYLGRVLTKQYGNKDGYSFSYDEEGKIIGISYYEVGDEATLRYSYLYDILGRVTFIKEGNDDYILYSYSYNKNNNLDTITSFTGDSLTYVYGLKDEVSMVKQAGNGTTSYELVSSYDRRKEVSPAGVMDNKSALYYSCFFPKVKGHDNDGNELDMCDANMYRMVNGEYEIESPYQYAALNILSINKDNFLPYYKVENVNNFLCYNFDVISKTNKDITVGCLFRFSEWRNREILYVFDDGQNESIRIKSGCGIEMDETGKIGLYYFRIECNSHPLVKEKVKIMSLPYLFYDSWNYIMINVKTDANNNITYTVYINNDKVSQTFTNQYLIGKLDYYHMYVGRNDSDWDNYLCFGEGDYTSLFACFEELSQREIEEHRKMIYENILDVLENGSSWDQSINTSKQIYCDLDDTGLKEYEFIPLNGDFVTSENNKPINITFKDGYIQDFSKAFVWDDILKQRIFDSSDFGSVQYEKTFSTTPQLISIRMNVTYCSYDESSEQADLFKVIIGNSSLRFFVRIDIEDDREGEIYYQCNNGSLIGTGLYSYKDSFDSVVLEIEQGTFSLYADGDEYVANINLTLGNVTIILGENYNGKYSNLLIGLGSIDSSKVKSDSHNIETDVLGRLLSNKILGTFKSNLIETSYTHTLTRLTTESIKVNNTFYRTYSYGYDGLNRIIYKVLNGSKTDYTYDARGYLIKEKDYSRTINYTYDDNGNILTVVNQGAVISSFTYDNLYKDRLNSFYNSEGYFTVEYNANNPYEMTGIKITNTSNYKYQFSWEGRRLSSLIYNGINYTYNYDDQGRRIRKISPTETVLYTYEEDKLVSEKHGDDYYIRYHYGLDGRVMFFELIDNNVKQKYYYLWNQIEIIGIVNQNGEVVVTYSYDAYGNVTIGGIDASTIGVKNPFLYRGYYYDHETQLFYCNSRYYSPELCRFISLDSIDYLEPESINGLNLYAYCGNDPINYADPSGHAPEWLQGLAIGLAILGAVLVIGAVTVLTCGVGTLAGTMAGAVIYGAAQGIAIGAAVGVVGGGIVGGIASDWSAEGILIGMGIGLGAGAIVGGVIGGFAGASSFTANSAYISQYGGNVKEVLSAYKGNPRLKVLNSNTTAYRTWGGTSGKFGHWISPKNYGSAARSMLSLPPGNTAANTSQFLISKGSTVLSGKAAALFGQTGGGIQWWIGLL